MPVKGIKSQTMRIDLIPDVPAKGDRHPTKRVVVKSTGRRSGERIRTKLSEREVFDGDTGLYRDFLQAVYDATLITDIDGVITDVNVRAVEFLQWSADELRGASIVEVISGAGRDLLDMLVENLGMERHSLIQAYCIRKDGSIFPSEIAVSRFRANGGLCFFIRDITIRRQAEEMLRTEHNAIQNSASGIAVADLDACLEYVNPAFVNMLHYPDGESMVEVDVRDVLGRTDVTEQMLKQVLDESSTWRGEMHVVAYDGSEMDLGVLAACNRNSNGDTVGVVFSFTDLSDRKRAEEAMRRAEQQRVMLESLGAACHHLGQPATVLTVSIEGIKSRINSDDEVINELVDKGVSASEHLGDVLRKLNEVNVYRTTSYLTDENDVEHHRKNRIIDI